MRSRSVPRQVSAVASRESSRSCQIPIYKQSECQRFAVGPGRRKRSGAAVEYATCAPIACATSAGCTAVLRRRGSAPCLPSPSRPRSMVELAHVRPVFGLRNTSGRHWNSPERVTRDKKPSVAGIASTRGACAAPAGGAVSQVADCSGAPEASCGVQGDMCSPPSLVEAWIAHGTAQLVKGALAPV